MKFIAITGSIGCGKTTISNILRDMGYVVYDIDKWVKYMYYNEKFLNIIYQHFPQCFDERIFNKRKLRNLVFDNVAELKKLEGLIHPFLTEKLRKYIRKNKKEDIAFVDIALLYEMNWDKFFDFVILADVDKETQKQRVMKRDNITAEDFEKINKIQMPMEIKREKVDFIINTGVDKNKLIKQIINILGFLENYE